MWTPLPLVDPSQLHFANNTDLFMLHTPYSGRVTEAFVDSTGYSWYFSLVLLQCLLFALYCCVTPGMSLFHAGMGLFDLLALISLLLSIAPLLAVIAGVKIKKIYLWLLHRTSTKY